MASVFKVAIVGSGPSGFYAAEALMEALPAAEVSILDRLPVPFGLVRSGVAPDHPKLKQAAIVYDRIAQSEKIHFIGNVQVGLDVTIDELRESYNCIIFAYGADRDKALDLPGENLPGSYAAREFIGWYNGHQDHQHHKFDLEQEVVAIIGQGNVALDVARILAKPAAELRNTDISEAALDALASSRVREVHIFGRRGPADAKFSSQELAEFNNIPGCRSVAEACDLQPFGSDAGGDALNKETRRKLDLLSAFSASDGLESSRRCHFHFHYVPLAVLGQDRVTGTRFLRSGSKSAGGQDSQQCLDFNCGLLFRAVGYRGQAIAGLPFDEVAGVLRHRAGRLVGRDGNPLHGLYATGWIKRGATGVIGTNRADSLETVETLLSDLSFIDEEQKAGASGLRALLLARGKKAVDYRQWLQIDRVEIAAGRAKSKPREKITSLAGLLAAAG